jgi:hypothetical protein
LGIIWLLAVQVFPTGIVNPFVELVVQQLLTAFFKANAQFVVQDLLTTLFNTTQLISIVGILTPRLLSGPFIPRIPKRWCYIQGTTNALPMAISALSSQKVRSAGTDKETQRASLLSDRFLSPTVRRSPQKLGHRENLVVASLMLQLSPMLTAKTFALECLTMVAASYDKQAGNKRSMLERLHPVWWFCLLC